MSKDADGGERALRREKYWVEMGPQLAARLELDRAELVLRYRDHPEVWPDGIGGWYRADEWAVMAGEDGGRRAVRIGGVAVSGADYARWELGGRRGLLGAGQSESYRERVDAAKGVLAAVEARVGVKPWEAEGVSERTWYRRKKEERGDGDDKG